MRTLASFLPQGGTRRNGGSSSPGARWWAWLAAAVLHAAVLALLLSTIRTAERTVARRPVPLAPAPAAVSRPPTDVATGRPVLRPLPVRPARAPVNRQVAPVPRPVPRATMPGVRPAELVSDLVRAYRRGTAPVDSTALTEEGLRRTALAEATRSWNLAFLGLIPQIREDMFLEALEKSPFPRR